MREQAAQIALREDLRRGPAETARAVRPLSPCLRQLSNVFPRQCVNKVPVGAAGSVARGRSPQDTPASRAASRLHSTGPPSHALNQVQCLSSYPILTLVCLTSHYIHHVVHTPRCCITKVRQWTKANLHMLVTLTQQTCLPVPSLRSLTH